MIITLDAWPYINDNKPVIKLNWSKKHEQR